MKTIYNIIDFGAVAGLGEIQTEKIQVAIDATFLAGGGEVVVPEGELVQMAKGLGICFGD